MTLINEYMEFIQNYVPLNVELFRKGEKIILISAKNILFRNKIFFSVLNI